MNCTVRTATLEDENNVLALLDECINFQCQIEQKERKEADPRQVSQNIFAKIITSETDHIFVAEDQDSSQLVGVLTFFEQPHLRSGKVRGHVEDFFVTGSMRSQGVGHQLWEAVTEYCRQQGITVLKLTSGLELTQAHAFYEKQGGSTKERSFRFDLGAD